MILITCLALLEQFQCGALMVSEKQGVRWLGRDLDKGVVMNPVDHPMGGGEGKNSGGHPRSRKDSC